MAESLRADLMAQAEALLALCRAKGLRVATAESCTGGLVAGVLTEIPGSSDVVERGFVSYSNEAKTQMLGVPAALIATHGAVSEPVARAMAGGALENSPADIALAVTGIAGPGGGSAAKPVGLVHFAVARRGQEVLHRECRYGDRSREEIRGRSVAEALGLIEEAARRGETG